MAAPGSWLMLPICCLFMPDRRLCPSVRAGLPIPRTLVTPRSARWLFVEKPLDRSRRDAGLRHVDFEQAQRKPDLICADPTIEELYPQRKPWMMNLLFGAIYVAIGIACAVGFLAFCMKGSA
jgi:hypothetical protein